MKGGKQGYLPRASRYNWGLKSRYNWGPAVIELGDHDILVVLPVLALSQRPPGPYACKLEMVMSQVLWNPKQTGYPRPHYTLTGTNWDQPMHSPLPSSQTQRQYCFIIYIAAPPTWWDITLVGNDEVEYVWVRSVKLRHTYSWHSLCIHTPCTAQFSLCGQLYMY